MRPAGAQPGGHRAQPKGSESALPSVLQVCVVHGCGTRQTSTKGMLRVVGIVTVPMSSGRLSCNADPRRDCKHEVLVDAESQTCGLQPDKTIDYYPLVEQSGHYCSLKVCSSTW